MKIYIGTDHAGYEQKNELATSLRSEGHEVEDMGPHSYDALDDYPDFIAPVAHGVASDRAAGDDDVFGIILGGSGQGEAMCANRIAGVRATTYYAHDLEIIRLGRDHNNANVLSFGARFLSEEQMKEAIALFLATPFSEDERHVRRLVKIETATQK